MVSVLSQYSRYSNDNVSAWVNTWTLLTEELEFLSTIVFGSNYNNNIVTAYLLPYELIKKS